MDKKQIELLQRILSHFDMHMGDTPSCTVYAEGRSIWGLVSGELEEDLLELYELIEEAVNE